jgi:DoxX-like protein
MTAYERMLLIAWRPDQPGVRVIIAPVGDVPTGAMASLRSIRMPTRANGCGGSSCDCRAKVADVPSAARRSPVDFGPPGTTTWRTSVDGAGAMEAEMNRNRALWLVQGLLAALFVFAGGMKLITPVAALSAMSPFPGAFLQFIGVCEVLGAVGLILPWALRIRPELTPLAAAGLVVIMLGATASTLAIGGGVMALVPAVVGLLAALVALGRRSVLPRAARARPALQPVA